MFALKNGILFDGVKAPNFQRMTLIIEKETIIDVFPDDSHELTDMPVWDLEGRTISPGFIDCHMHLTLDELPDKEHSLEGISGGGVVYNNADIYVGFMAAGAARDTLFAGFTTVSDGGGVNHIDVALKEAIQKNYITGPEVLTSCQIISAWPSYFRGLEKIANGPWEIRAAVREHMYYGADHIKLELSPPIRCARGMEKCEYTDEEILAALDEAHAANLIVSAHARSGQTIAHALELGLDAVVHGTNIDDAGIELLLKTGRYIYPTLASPESKSNVYLRAAKSFDTLRSLRETGTQHWESLKRAYNAGVKMALSTDCGTLGLRHGSNAEEFLRMKELGMSNLECMKAGTSEAAKALGISSRLGTLTPGKQADIAILNGNPVEDLSAVMKVDMVIKKGKIVKNSIT